MPSPGPVTGSFSVNYCAPGGLPAAAFTSPTASARPPTGATVWSICCSRGVANCRDRRPGRKALRYRDVTHYKSWQRSHRGSASMAIAAYRGTPTVPS
jgi:hypothetical protein